MATVLLVRHGQTDWNLSKRYQGWGAVPLNETGHEQASELGQRLASDYDITTVYASDLLRVQQTVATIVKEGGAPTEGTPTSALRERDKGVLQGLTEEDIQAIDPEFRPTGLDSDKVTVTPPEGESYEDMYDRVVRWWTATIEPLAGDDEDVLVVAHGGSIRCLLAYLQGVTLSTAMEMYHTENCSVTEVQLTPTRTAVR